MKSSKIRINKHYLLFGALIFILVFVTAGHLVFLTFYAFLIVTAGSYLHLYFFARTMNVGIDIEKTVFRAGDLVSWRLTCESKLPVTVLHVEQYKNGQLLIQKNGSITFDENLWIDYHEVFYSRGIFDIGTVTVRANDLFGIMTLTMNITLKCQLKIYPNLLKVGSDNGGNDIFLDMININARRENQYMISDIRKYMPGDSTKKIHWKVSAKRNELFVRKYESTSGISVVILADLSRSNYDLDAQGQTEERIADTCASLVRNAARCGINADVYLHTSQAEHHQITSIYRYHDFIERLTLTPSSAETSFHDFITRQLTRFDRMTRIFIISASNDPSISTLVTQRYYYYDVSLISCSDTPLENAIHFCSILDVTSPQPFSIAGL